MFWLKKNSQIITEVALNSMRRKKSFHEGTWGMRHHGDLLISAKWMNCIRLLKPGLNRIRQVLHGYCFWELEAPLLLQLAEGCLIYGRSRLSLKKKKKLPFIPKNKDREEEIVEHFKRYLYCPPVKHLAQIWQLFPICKFTHIKKAHVLNKRAIFPITPTFLGQSQGSIWNHILKQMLFSEL